MVIKSEREQVQGVGIGIILHLKQIIYVTLLIDVQLIVIE